MPANHNHKPQFHTVAGCALLLLPLSGHAQTAPTPGGDKTTVKMTAGRNAPLVSKPAAPTHRLTNAVHPVTKGVNAVPESAALKGVVTKPAAPAFLASILVRADSNVNGSHFTLGKIADIQCKDKTLAARLMSVEIGTISLPGLARMFGPGDITVHLRAAGLSDLLDHKQLELIAPPEARVTRAAHAVPSDEITRTAIASVQRLIADIPNATLEAASGGDNITVPVGNVRVVAGAYRGLPESGTITVPVSILVDGNVTQTANVALHIRRKMRTVILRRTLEPHDIVGADDVTLALVDLPAGLAHPLGNASAAIGKRTTRRIVQDAPVSADWLETPPDIKANTRVTIEFVFGSVHITAPGLTQQAGMIGETIRVYAQDTHKELSALIVDDHTVQLIEAE